MMKQTSALIIKEYVEKRNVRGSVRHFLRKTDNRGVNLKT
ncbi:hypothetical protein BSUBE1_2012 [Bacillus subtilis E1]|uniref:Uncharacterized protein n=1 Tax=Bacillus subtilis TaxID=1423 RepID=A0A0D1L690_BACIU|nr:hypothetical protein BSSX_2168 [Bacillus subtilis]KIN53212.1 hypothetical protein B4146_2136 [Bacillus subtilis]KIU11266.1 hypothetical protein SC09_Contig24orf00185 [Bacillus subtilis]KZD95335.1 hypothetical protein B4122_0307 [Bacillus subtilis]CCU58643.1 hypothetical protein BSUBE1_2012 [Bacillus subtilis E1]